jgi:endonuclease YncB( thermonuclease family)
LHRKRAETHAQAPSARGDRHAASVPSALLRWLLVLVPAALLASCGTTPMASCTDFSDQRAAQQAANTADGDHDGRYCERLPCPCAGPNGTGAGGERSTAARSDAGRRAKERPAAEAHEPLVARVAHVVDGDTVDFRLGDGTVQRVRLIGIDTPEKSALRSGHVECGGVEATKATGAIASRWSRVTLRPDPTQDAYDRYGRLLAYVEPAASPGTTYQQEILREGWAKVYVYDGEPFARVGPFQAAARQAQAARAGVWTRCGGNFRQALG